MSVVIVADNLNSHHFLPILEGPTQPIIASFCSITEVRIIIERSRDTTGKLSVISRHRRLTCIDKIRDKDTILLIRHA